MNHMMRRVPRPGMDSSPRHKYTMTAEGPWRTLTGLGLALVVLGGTILGIGSAQAETNASGHGPGQMVNWSGYTGFWLGTYQTSNGLAICVTPSGDSPVGQGGSDPYTISPGWVDDEGVEASAEQLAESAYILWWMGSSPSDYAAGMAKLATFTVLGYDSVRVYGSSREYDFDVFVDGSDGQEIANKLGMLADVQALVDEARGRANTWDGTTVDAAANFSQIGVPGDTIVASVKFPGLGTGYEVRFEVTGPDGSVHEIEATTDADGMANMSYVTPENVPGTYSVAYSIGDVPPSLPVAYWPGGSNPQDMFFAAPPSRALSGEFPGEVTVRFNPEVGTQVSAAKVSAGDVLSDTVTSENLDSSLSWSLTGALHGPAPTVDGSCEGVEWSGVLGEREFSRDIAPSEIDADGTSVLSGLGPWQVPLTFDDMCVSYSEHLSGRDSSGVLVQEADHPVGSPGQTALVVARIPEVSSAVSDTEPLPGDVVWDSVTVTNVVLAAAGVSYEWNYQGILYGPVEPGGTWDDAAVVRTWDRTIIGTDMAPDLTATLSGLGEFTMPIDQPAGCYSYAASVDVLGSDGSTYHASHPVGDPSQTSCVPSGVITIGTEVSSQSANPSDTITDRFSATGLAAAVGESPVSWAVHVTLAAADVDANGQCSEADWSDAETVGEADLDLDPTWIQDGALNLAGVGAYTIPAVGPSHCLTYGETLTGTWTGDDVSVVHPLGEESQTTFVAPGTAPLISVTTGGTAIPGHGPDLPLAVIWVTLLVVDTGVVITMSVKTI